MGRKKSQPRQGLTERESKMLTASLYQIIADGSTTDVFDPADFPPVTRFADLESGGRRARLDALIDSGWIGRLNPLALRVYLVYLRFGNETGISRIGAGKLARLLGRESIAGVKRARRELVRAGLLNPLDHLYSKKGGRYLVEIPSREVGAAAASHRSRNGAEIAGRIG
jgi:hypothetical protein